MYFEGMSKLSVPVKITEAALLEGLIKDRVPDFLNGSDIWRNLSYAQKQEVAGHFHIVVKTINDVERGRNRSPAWKAKRVWNTGWTTRTSSDLMEAICTG